MTKTIELKRLSIDLNCDWTQVVGRWNWIEFNIFKVYMEKDKLHGMFEIELYVLGFGVRFYWTYDKVIMKKRMGHYQEIIDKDEWIRLK